MRRLKQHERSAAMVLMGLIPFIAFELWVFASPPMQQWLWLHGTLLAIPCMIASGALIGFFGWLRYRKQVLYKAAEMQQIAFRTAADKRREAALQAYLSEMTILLLERGLHESVPGDEVRTIAHIRTLAVLSDLDKRRKSFVLQFLYEAGLINKDNRIIDLSGANLDGIRLIGQDLRGIDLSGTSLGGSSFRNADLRGANLCDVDFELAFLLGARLDDANPETARCLRVANMIGATGLTEEQITACQEKGALFAWPE
jgi:uncharacterized protein YjbI with pentapeptide repeats